MIEDVKNVPVEPDPAKPVKAIAAAVMAGISSVLAAGVPLPLWLKVLLGALLAGLTVFLAPNPLRMKKARPGSVSQDEPLF